MEVKSLRLDSGMLRCSTRGEYLHKTEFHRNSCNSRGFSSRCKECAKEYNKMFKYKRQQEFKLGIRKHPNTQVCKVCNKTKTKHEFYKSNYTKSGLESTCIDCRSAEARKRYHERRRRQCG